MLLGGQTGQRVEDVRVVGRALLHRPVLHRRGHGVGHHRVEGFGVLDRRDDRLVDQLREPLLHHRKAEHVLAEDRTGQLVDIEGGRGRYIGLDVFDCLQADVICTHKYPNRMAYGPAGLFPRLPDSMRLGTDQTGCVSQLLTAQHMTPRVRVLILPLIVCRRQVVNGCRPDGLCGEGWRSPTAGSHEPWTCSNWSSR